MVKPRKKISKRWLHGITLHSKFMMNKRHKICKASRIAETSSSLDSEIA